MKGKYTHKFIIYHKENIQNNFLGLVEKLANLDDTILLDLFEQLAEESGIFERLRGEFYLKNGYDYDEILGIDEEINVKTNKVLAFVRKYPEFGELIAGIDYFDGEEEYVERFWPQDVFDEDAIFKYSFNDDMSNLHQRLILDYFYGFEDANQLNIFLKEIGAHDLLQH